MTRPTAFARLLAGLVALLVVVGPATRVLADPAGPTDYRSEILSIDPPTDGIALEILGGDSFVSLTVDPGVEVMVIGYRGEEYLWFRADGSVLQNQRSPSTYLNEDRYGTDAPESADPDADPDWSQVASDGGYAWHDHRAHWMQSVPPFGKGPGDRIVEGVIPLFVDGAEVDVTVVSTWLAEPSGVPVWLGIVLGVAIGAIGLLGRRARRPWFPVVLAPAAVALAAGAWQYVSLPPETGPRPVWWVLPAVAVLGGIVALVGAVRRPADRFTGAAGALVGGVSLVVWGWVKRDGLGAAIVPTDAPDWFDRFATAWALVGGAVLVVLALWELFGPVRRPTPAADALDPSDATL